MIKFIKTNRVEIALEKEKDEDGNILKDSDGKDIEVKRKNIKESLLINVNQIYRIEEYNDTYINTSEKETNFEGIKIYIGSTVTSIIVNLTFDDINEILYNHSVIINPSNE